MAQNKTKRSKILEKVRTEEKKQQLFVLPVDLIEQFKNDCKREGVTMSKVLEALIREYMGDK